MRTSFLYTILFLSALLFTPHAIHMADKALKKTALSPTKHIYQDGAINFLQTRLQEKKNDDSIENQGTSMKVQIEIPDSAQLLFENSRFDNPDDGELILPENLSFTELSNDDPNSDSDEDDSDGHSIEEIVAQKDQDHPIAEESKLEPHPIELPPIDKHGAGDVKVDIPDLAAVVANTTDSGSPVEPDPQEPEEISVQEIAPPANQNNSNNDSSSSGSDDQDNQEPSIEEIVAQKDQDHPVAPESNLQPQPIELPPVDPNGAGDVKIDLDALKPVIGNTTITNDTESVQQGFVPPEQVPVEDVVGPVNDDESSDDQNNSTSASDDSNSEPSIEEIVAQNDQDHPVAPESNLQPQPIELPPVDPNGAGDVKVELDALKPVIGNTTITNDTESVQQGFVPPEQVPVEDVVGPVNDDENSDDQNNSTSSSDDSNSEPSIEEIVAQKDQDHPVAPESNLQPQPIELPPVDTNGAGDVKIDLDALKPVIGNTTITNDTESVQQGFVPPEQVPVEDIVAPEADDSNSDNNNTNNGQSDSSSQNDNGSSDNESDTSSGMVEVKKSDFLPTTNV